MTGDLRAVLAATAANVGIATAKVVGFVLTGSVALLAEFFHSVADTADQGLLLLGRWRAAQAETPRHPFGFGRERYFWAFVVAVLLFALGALGALYKGATGLADPQPVTHRWWGLGILVVALAFDGLSLRTAVRAANTRRLGSWWRFVRSTKNPELPVVLLEDSGAVTGVLLAVAGLGLTVVTGDPRFDAAGSIGVGVVLAVMAGVLAREMKSLLIGEGANPDQQQRIGQLIEDHRHVTRMVYLRTLYLGPEDLLVETKVEVDQQLTAEEVATAIDEIEVRIRRVVDEARIISVEPDVPEPDDPDAPDWVTNHTAR